MEFIETNMYLIENLEELTCKYKNYRIRGLSPDFDDFHKNVQLLATRLSNITKSPCVPYTTENGVFIAQPDGYPELPESLDLVRTTIRIEESGVKELKFDSLDAIDKVLALKFLQSSIQRNFYNSPNLWQPKSGYPFYNKSSDKRFSSKDVDLYRGFTFRVVPILGEGIGICIDVRSKYVARNVLPTKIDRKTFEKYRGMNCVYEYGSRWYEIKIEGLSDLTASEIKIPPQGISLFEDVHNKAGKYKSQNLLSLPKDCSVLIYYTSNREPRHVPSGLCRLTYSTDHPLVKRIHSRTIKPPHRRREEIKFVVNKYFKNLSFGSSKIVLSDNPLVIDERRLKIPDLKFGNNKVLSASKTPLDEFSTAKKEYFYSKDAGLYIKKPFDRQYIILPKSVFETFGKKFIEDIKKEINQLFEYNDNVVYKPIIITYDDSVQKSIYRIGRAIIKAVEDNELPPGYGLVMIPRIKSKRLNKEDELANLVMRELRKRGIFVSIIHTSVPSESYEYVNTNGDGEWKLTSDIKQRKKYKGYIKNVVLNKILILNSFWPFVLETPLNADLIIGIDVKNNTAGFTIINKNGSEISFYHSESEQKEQLSKNHIQTKIVEIITEEQNLSYKNIEEIVIHRQGKLFPQEKIGAIEALKELANKRLISEDYRYTFVEIRETSRIPLRLFKVIQMPNAQKELVFNPTIGTYVYDVFENEAFICNTGPPYNHRGTTIPLHVIKDGSLSMIAVLEDIFYLSNLTWTKIDSCSRQPLSIKMTDIRLREFAGEYDYDALRFGEED